MFGLENILKFSETKAACLRKTVLKLPHIWPKTFLRSQGNCKFYKKLSFMLSRDIFL